MNEVNEMSMPEQEEMLLSNVDMAAWALKPPIRCDFFFDAINVRTRRDLTTAELRLLREHAKSADVNPGNYIPGFSMGVLTIVAPKAAALEFIADLPGAMVNRIEVAVDLIVDPETKWRLRDLFDAHFVQPWHGAQVQNRFDGGTYTRSRGQRQFVWYADRHSKATGEVDCFHLEGRHVGVKAVRRIGIEHPRDLLTFDHEAYWRKHLTLFEIDPERLGRLHLNRLKRERRRHPLWHETHGYVYDRDRATGNTLYRIWAFHPDQPEPYRSVQRFVDQYGRGEYLRTHPVTHYIVNMSQTTLPKITPSHKDIFDLLSTSEQSRTESST